MSNCPGCGRPYTQTPGHLIDTLPGFRMVPYCDVCHSRLSLGSKKSYITSLINQWRRGSNWAELETVWAMALARAYDEHKQRF